jgi:tetratricopeptide (TPR) repeat protein
LDENPTILLQLTRVLFQTGDTEGALLTAKEAVNCAAREGDLLSEARAEEMLFRLYRQTGNEEQAHAALERSLRRILVLKAMDLPSVSESSIERHLAGLLEYYGLEREVHKSYRRALAASRSNLVEVEITLTDMARAGLTLGNTSLTREAVESALDQGLPAENGIYIALWHQLTLKKGNHRTDGLSEQILSQAGDARGWLKTLRDFGLGTVSASELEKNASGIPEKTEADFYRSFGEGSTKKGKKALERVAKSPAVDLVEVKIAADLSAQPQSYSLPEDISLP